MISLRRIIYTTSVEIRTRRLGRTSVKGVPRNLRYRRDQAFRTCTVAECSTFCRITDTTRKSRPDWEGKRPIPAWTTSRSSKFYIPVRTLIRKVVVTRRNWPASRIWAGKARRKGSTWLIRNRSEMTGNRICPVKSSVRRMEMGTVRRRLRSPLCRIRPRGNSRAVNNPNRWNNILLVRYHLRYIVIVSVFRWYKWYNRAGRWKRW